VTFNWDEFKQTGEWIAFNEVGDQTVGIIKTIRQGADFNGNPCPELILEDDSGEERTLTAGQVLLKAALAEKAPQEGDRIRIVYTGQSEARPGKAPAKVFQVDVKRGPHRLQNAAVANTEDPF